MKKCFNQSMINSVTGRLLRAAGFTLLELMVGLGVFSVLMVIAFSIMGIGAQLAGFHAKSASASQFISDGLNQLTTVLPQVVKINSCNCSGTIANISSCTWSDTSPWNDPVINSGVTTGSIIFDAEYEAYFGGPGAILASGYLGAEEIATTTIGSVAKQICGTHAYVSPGLTSRGCRLRAQISYTAPTLEAGSVASRPGELDIKITNTAATSLSPTIMKIGDASGLQKQGLTGISCGIMNPTSSQVGTTFVMNLQTKIKNSISENPASNDYESWYPTGKNYNQGFFREAKLKFSFANLFIRGAYQWRTLSNKNCLKVGDASTSKDNCCSGAFDGAACVDCVASGSSGINSSCCSEKAVGGICR